MTECSPRLLLCAIFTLAGFMFLSGIDWGLPSRRFDSNLFGGHPIWTGQEILDLAGNWDDSADRGADVAMHPLANRRLPIFLNQTDAQRAQILRRYRLYSAQPDEMITFRSLSSMHPARGDFDPRLYQYGGLWIYPVGALLKLAAEFKFITINSNLAFYLDHPGAFARFYVVARLYSAAWALIGVAVVYFLAMEWTGKSAAALFAACSYSVMPVVVNMAHEAKPHLPGAVLTLAALFTAMRFVRTGHNRYWIFSAVLCGAAFGMVLSGAVAFSILPVMVLLRPISWTQRIKITTAAATIALAVFIITNPYLPLNLLLHPNLVQSNLGNSRHFYQPSLTLTGTANAISLLTEGTSLPLFLSGFVGLVFLISRRGASKNGWLFAAPALLIAAQFILLAHDQPAEYGRFAITLDILLAITAAKAISSMTRWRSIAQTLLLLSTLVAGLRYVANFLADNTRISNRTVAVQTLAGLKHPRRILAVWAEPAPYSMPPVDLFNWNIVLLPPHSDAGEFQLGDDVVTLRPVDHPAPQVDDPPWIFAPISWANKPFQIVDR